MNTIAPPSLTAINDALAVVRLALNPQSANEVIEHLANETAKHQETLKAIIGRKDQLDAREKDLQEREANISVNMAAVVTRDAQVTARERAAATREQQLAEAHAAHTKRVGDNEAAQKAWDEHAAAVKKDIETRQAALDKANAARTSALDAREAAIAKRETEHAARLARLKALTE